MYSPKNLAGLSRMPSFHLGLPDLAGKNTVCLVKFEFHIDIHNFFHLTMLHAIFKTDLKYAISNTTCYVILNIKIKKIFLFYKYFRK